MGKGADSASQPQDCPLRDKMMRSPVPVPVPVPASVLNNNIPKDGFNFDTKKKHCSVPKESRPCYPLSGLQRLLKNFRKPDQQEEPKSVGLSIVIENSWTSYNSCCKDQSKSVSGYNTKDHPAKITPACKSKPQIVNKSMVAAQCKDRSPNGSSKHRSSVILSPTSVVACTPLPPIDFLDACYLCKRSLGPGLDIYMYRGDRAFCSAECRLKQMTMDEQSEKCASAVIKRAVTTTPPRARRSTYDGNRTRVHARGLTTAAA